MRAGLSRLRLDRLASASVADADGLTIHVPFYESALAYLISDAYRGFDQRLACRALACRGFGRGRATDQRIGGVGQPSPRFSNFHTAD